MGLLDDAIREHLDLKRRRGADPTEVERQEREALGSPRAVEAPAPGAAADDAAGDPEAAGEPLAGAGAVSLTDRIEPDVEWDDAPRASAPTPAAAGDDGPPDADPAAPPREDVLEKTPEFLEDTPEHDRLWFEQRPPRDFDFDG